MSWQNSNEPMLDMFIFETSQMIEQLEQVILTSEKSNCYTSEAIDEIFRIMHTIKGSSAMMLFNNISDLTHHMEDLFFYLREEKPEKIDCSALCDLVLTGVDFIKIEMEKVKNRDDVDGDESQITEDIKEFLAALKQDNASTSSTKHRNEEDKKQQYYISQDKTKAVDDENAYKTIIHFEEGCEMENIRAYTIVHNLKDISDEVYHVPEDIIDNDESVEVIRQEGFKIYFKTDLAYEKIHEFFMQTVFLKNLELIHLENDDVLKELAKKKETTMEEQPVEIPNIFKEKEEEKEHSDKTISSHQSIISVSVDRLDKLMDLVGEMVIAEAMVLQNPDLEGLELENFQKSARQLSKITNDIQDMVMSIRMVPLSATFHKMHRIVRDMCKKLDKEVQLDIIGQETEVDKNIIEHISDPLMHLVRNALDHGIESPEDRRKKGKSPAGSIQLEAKNAGSDVVITIKDDGKGLNKEKILKKAEEHGLLHRSKEDMTDKEIFNLLFLPGFSTKEDVSEFSGRGVGMDVVTKNIEAVGGSISIDSIEEKGTIITLKIPLTLAIIDGMNIKVGNARYILPTISIKESFRPKEEEIIMDTEENEMIMVRGQCYSILRLHRLFHVKNSTVNITEGILIMVEHDDKTICIFADELLGQQQVVVKTLPKYIQSLKKTRGLAGCTLLGDGSISLILDTADLVNYE